MKFTCERKVGRVIELRVFELKNAADLTSYGKAILDEAARMPEKIIICADHRPVKIYPQEVTDAMVQLFTKINSRLERAALLVSRTNATFAMQVQRIVRESANQERQVFFEALEMISWLRSTVTPEELTRIQQHLNGWNPAQTTA